MSISQFKRLVRNIALFLTLCLLLDSSTFAQTYTLEEGKRLFDLEEYEKAKDVLLQVVEKEPENPEVNFLLCKTFLYLGDTSIWKPPT